jgi:hypothetical protein
MQRSNRPWIVALLIGLPLMYVLSAGPATWLYRRHHKAEPESLPATGSLGIIYGPLNSAVEASPRPVESAMRWYISLWET